MKKHIKSYSIKIGPKSLLGAFWGSFGAFLAPRANKTSINRACKLLFGTKFGQVGDKMGQVGTKTSQVGTKLGPSRVKLGPSLAQVGPGWAKLGPTKLAHFRSSKLTITTEDYPTCCRRWPKMAPKNPT